MSRIRIAFASAAPLFAAVAGHAHPGHGSGDGILHLLTEPLHAPVVLAAIAALGFGALALGQRRARRRVDRRLHR